MFVYLDVQGEKKRRLHVCVSVCVLCFIIAWFYKYMQKCKAALAFSVSAAESVPRNSKQWSLIFRVHN